MAKPLRREDLPADALYLRAALIEARKAVGHTRPNPPVGAVVVCNGKIIGRGRHRRCGADHAEVAAMKDARRKLRREGLGEDLRGATVYVTLEPCSRPGRVGACTEALVAAGIRRVVWALPDPNPRNRGRAARILRKAGIEGAVFPWRRHAACGALRAAMEDLIAPFAKHVVTGLPYVTVKLALSLDGKICDDRGEAKWISSPRSRQTTGALRERVDCVLVGGETVRRDNPSLLCHTKRNDDLYRAVVSKSGRLPPGAQIFTDEARARTLVFSSPREALAELGRRGFLHVLCEGGLKLARALAAENLVDAWLTVLAPVVIGEGPLAEARRFPGDDALILFRARPAVAR